MTTLVFLSIGMLWPVAASVQDFDAGLNSEWVTNSGNYQEATERVGNFIATFFPADLSTRRLRSVWQHDKASTR